MIVESVELRMRYLVIYTMRTPTLSDFPRQENSHPYLIQTLPFNHKYPIEFLDHANEVNFKKTPRKTKFSAHSTVFFNNKLNVKNQKTTQ